MGGIIFVVKLRRGTLLRAGKPIRRNDGKSYCEVCQKTLQSSTDGVKAGDAEGKGDLESGKADLESCKLDTDQERGCSSTDSARPR